MGNWSLPIWNQCSIDELVNQKRVWMFKVLNRLSNLCEKIWAWDEIIFIERFYKLSSGILPNILFDMKLCHAMLYDILKGSTASLKNHFSKECTSVIRKDGSFKWTKKINYLPPHQALSLPSFFDSTCCKLEEDRKRDKISRGAL